MGNLQSYKKETTQLAERLTEDVSGGVLAPPTRSKSSVHEFAEPPSLLCRLTNPC